MTYKHLTHFERYLRQSTFLALVVHIVSCIYDAGSRLVSCLTVRPHPQLRHLKSHAAEPDYVILTHFNHLVWHVRSYQPKVVLYHRNMCLFFLNAGFEKVVSSFVVYDIQKSVFRLRLENRCFRRFLNLDVGNSYLRHDICTQSHSAIKHLRDPSMFRFVGSTLYPSLKLKSRFVRSCSQSHVVIDSLFRTQTL